jgi:hypothetical protein
MTFTSSWRGALICAIGVAIPHAVLAADNPKEKSGEIPSPATKPADELEKLREQIARDMAAVEQKLKEHDAGDKTRDLQKQILTNLDKLLERPKDPPPNENSQPMGGSASKDESSPMEPNSGSQSKPQRGASGSTTRRERREAQRRQEQQARGGPRPSPSPTPKNNGLGLASDPPPSGNPMAPRKGSHDSLADFAKDFWGQLPDTVRQEVDHYYREQFMPRYRDLLQQYYLRLAETERRSKEMNP